MEIGKLLTVVALCYCVQVIQGHEDYYKNVFEDNLAEMEDSPIVFKPKPLPSWLRGSYIRNGIGQLRTKKRKMKHIFDGFTKLAKVSFTEPPTFTTKFIKSNYYNESKALDDVAPYYMFKNPEPPFSMYEGLKALVRGFDNMNVNVIRLTEKEPEYLALNDIWPNYHFKLNLDTVGRIEEPVPGFGTFFSRLSAMSTSHPVQEYGTDNQINIVSTINPLGGGWMSLVRIKSIKNRELIARWEVERLPYLHSFAMTKNYAVLICAPTYLNLAGMVHYWETFEGLVTEKDGTSQIFVVDLHNGAVRKIEKKKTGFMMHFINAHEVDDRYLVVDGVVFESMKVLGSPDVDTMLDRESRKKLSDKDGVSAASRFTIDLQTLDVKIQPHNVTDEKKFVLKLDMPVINEEYRFKANCYVYGIASEYGPDTFQIVKKDLCNNGQDLIWGPKDHYPSEPWFVATPGGKKEDDGLLMAFVMDGAKKKSYLVLLDASTMLVYTQAEMPTYVPWGLHGRFFPEEITGQCVKGQACP